MSPVLVHVALLHHGLVLVDDDGRLPGVPMADEDDDARFTAVLDRVGADVYRGPILRVAEDRYLDVVGCRAVPPPAGTWVEPAALADPALAALVARTVREQDAPPPRRPAWFRPGWYDEVETWVDASLAGVGRRRTGPMRPEKVWSISAVLRVPTDGGDVWFKAAAEVFHAEAAIHRVLAAHFPDDVPVLLAEDDARAWLLMEPLAGCTDADRAPGAGAALASRWARVQLASLDLREELRAAGCPVRDADATIDAFRRVLADGPELARLTGDELAAVRGLQDDVETLVRELWACGLPDAVTHGDLHLGNVAYDGSELRVFDLTDVCLSHPLLDGCHLTRFDDRQPADDDLFAAFVHPWREACPHADVDRAMQLAFVVDLVFQADTFDRIARATEDASTYELGGVVAWLLRRIPDAVAAARSGG
jgi:aminoglycoside phosphotransferase (APT) family kinase protein